MPIYSSSSRKIDLLIRMWSSRKQSKVADVFSSEKLKKKKIRRTSSISAVHNKEFSQLFRSGINMCSELCDQLDSIFSHSALTLVSRGSL